MLRILGSRRKLCDRLQRREFLQAGALGTMGLGLSDLLQSDEARAAATDSPTFGRAKACILLYLYGSPSQLETFDVKPDAPQEIRGTLGAVSSAIPGLGICELLPETAKVVDRTTVVRSMTHPYPVHGIAYATTALPDPSGGVEVNPRAPEHYPFLGSVIDYLEEDAGVIPEIPRNFAMPFPLSTRRGNQPYRAGPYGGYLGAAYDPIWTEFRGEGTETFTQINRGVVQEFRDPYGGIRPEGYFELSSAARLRTDITVDRLNQRRSLLEQLDDARRAADRDKRADGFDRFRGMAFSLLTSSKLRSALDISKEPMLLREDYGMTLFGQGALAARRLVEAGGRLVSLFWDEFGLADSAWDTHYEHYRRMKDELCPSFDRGYPALIRDLDARGMLDETLVVCISEHGRTPKLNNATGGGRDHWSRAYCSILAGGGIARGRVIGKTDAIAGDVIANPVSPKDILATVYHLLGIDPHTLIPDRIGRPIPIAGAGHVRHDLLG